MKTMASLQFVAAFIVCVSYLDVTFAAQCMPDPTNPCRARCNGTTFDISNLFDYPWASKLASLLLLTLAHYSHDVWCMHTCLSEWSWATIVITPTCGAHALGILSAITLATTQTVPYASMRINTTIVDVQRIPCICLTTTLTLLSIKFSIFGELIGGEAALCMYSVSSVASLQNDSVHVPWRQDTRGDHNWIHRWRSLPTICRSRFIFYLEVIILFWTLSRTFSSEGNALDSRLLMAAATSTGTLKLLLWLACCILCYIIHQHGKYILVNGFTVQLATFAGEEAFWERLILSPRLRAIPCKLKQTMLQSLTIL